MSCDLDRIPSKHLLECLNSILPFLTNLFNSSLTSGIFQQFLKSALVTPILKKRCLVMSLIYALLLKYWKKLVLSQVSSYLNSHNFHNLQLTVKKIFFLLFVFILLRNTMSLRILLNFTTFFSSNQRSWRFCVSRN